MPLCHITKHCNYYWHICFPHYNVTFQRGRAGASCHILSLGLACCRAHTVKLRSLLEDPAPITAILSSLLEQWKGSEDPQHIEGEVSGERLVKLHCMLGCLWNTTSDLGGRDSGECVVRHDCKNRRQDHGENCVFLKCWNSWGKTTKDELMLTEGLRFMGLKPTVNFSTCVYCHVR